MSPTAARNVAAQITLTPGTVISRRSSGDSSPWRAISRSTTAISESRNSTWRRHAATVSASSSGSSSARSQARPLTPNRSDTGGRPTSRRTSTAWTSFLARAHQLLASRQPPAQHARPLIRRPHGVELAGRQQPRQRPRVEAVGLRPGLANTGIGGTDHDDAGDVRLEDPRDLPRAPRHLQRHPIARRKTRREQLKPLRRRRDPTSRAQRAALDDRDLAEIAVHVQADRSPHRSHLALLYSSTTSQNRRANDNDRCVLAAHPGKSQGRPPKQTRARSSSSNTA